MPTTVVPARMFARSFFWNSQAVRKRRVVSVLLIRALLDEPRYSIADPRDRPAAPPRHTPPKPKATSGKPGRPRARCFTWNDPKTIR